MNKKQPLISVIIPIYNVEKYLHRCINSVIAQNYNNLEIILVDDGSKDSSGKIADTYAKNHKNIRVIHKENGGLSSARNIAIKQSRGDWLAFIDSDDYVAEDFISELISLAIKNDSDIATCSFESFSDDGSVLKKSPSWPEKTLSGIEAVDDAFKNKRQSYITLNIFKKELFLKNNIKFPEGRYYEDLATKTKLLYCAKKVSYTNKKLYFYLIRKTSITGSLFSEARYNDFTSALNDTESFLLQKNAKPLFLNYFKLYSLFTLLNYLAREKQSCINAKRYWKEIRDQLKKIYKVTTFPNAKKKILYKILLTLSLNKTLYSSLYRKAKK